MEGLRANTEYSFSLAAISNKGIGAFTNELVQRTAQASRFPSVTPANTPCVTLQCDVLVSLTAHWSPGVVYTLIHLVHSSIHLSCSLIHPSLHLSSMYSECTWCLAHQPFILTFTVFSHSEKSWIYRSDKAAVSFSSVLHSFLYFKVGQSTLFLHFKKLTVTGQMSKVIRMKLFSRLNWRYVLVSRSLRPNQTNRPVSNGDWCKGTVLLFKICYLEKMDTI